MFTLIKRDPTKDDCAMVHKYDPNKLKRQNDSERVEPYEQCKKANRALRDAMETRDVLVLRDAIATAEQENVVDSAVIEETKALVPVLAAEIRRTKEKYYQTPEGAMDLYRQYINT